MDQGVKNASGRWLAVEDRDINERHGRSVRRFGEHEWSGGEKFLEEGRRRHGFTDLRQVHDPDGVQDFRRKKRFELRSVRIAEWNTLRVKLLPLLPQPGTCFSDQCGQLSRS